MRFLKVFTAFPKWGLIGILVNDWAALYRRGLILEWGLYTDLYSILVQNVTENRVVHLAFRYDALSTEIRHIPDFSA